MTSIKLKFVRRIKDRYGKVRYYLRRPDLDKHILLPSPKDPEFLRAYADAMGIKKKNDFRPNSFAYLIEDWQKSAHFLSLSQGTKKAYNRLLLSMQKEDYAEHLVSDFEARHIRRFIARHAETPAAANHRLKLFRILFDFAIKDGLRSDNPAKDIKKYKEKAEGQSPWTDEEIKVFEDYWPTGTVQRRAFALMLYTGQRRSDIVKISPKDRKDNLLEVTQKKTGTSLLIPIHPALQKELDPIKIGDAYLLSSNGIPFTANGFYMRFKKWREQAGLPAGLSPHGLRKTTAKKLAEAGCSTHEIAAITGHKTLSEIERYTKSADQEKMAIEAIKKLKR
ncbi:hypothetical protein FAI40_01820 [Acetobacteraceae bacterium]|nr:hypothetical protein FAI40_01820 [Acetobacteraceae bacterium]